MARPKKVQKTQEELQRNFRHVFQGLELSMRDYDNGLKGEAARIAGSIYILVHDYGKSAVSVLTQLKRKEVPFHNTAAPINPNNLMTEMPLVMARVGRESDYCPIGNQCPGSPQQPQRFSEWWETRVLRDNNRRIFTRKNLIFSMRHGEGGGHVSPDLDEQFAALSRQNSMGFTFFSGGREFVPEYGPLYATTRQLGYEVVATIRGHCSDLLT